MIVIKIRLIGKKTQKKRESYRFSRKQSPFFRMELDTLHAMTLIKQELRKKQKHQKDILEQERWRPIFLLWAGRSDGSEKGKK